MSVVKRGRSVVEVEAKFAEGAAKVQVGYGRCECEPCGTIGAVYMLAGVAGVWCTECAEANAEVAATF